jgi:DNA polymerase III gamma/tau subunit
MLEKMQTLATTISQPKLSEAMQSFSRIENDMKYSLNPRLLLEVTALSLFDENVKKN